MTFFSSGQKIIDADSNDKINIENESDISKQIRELIDTRVRPAVAMDGGDIVFHSSRARCQSHKPRWYLAQQHAAHHQRATERLHREHDPRVGHPLRSGHLHQHALQSRLGPGRAALAQPGQGILGIAEVVGAAGQPRVHVEPRLRRCQKRLKHVNQLRLEDVERRLLMGQQHHLKACDRHVAQQAKFSQVLRHCLLLVKELLELRHLGVPSAIAPALQVAAAHADLHDHRACPHGQAGDEQAGEEFPRRRLVDEF